MSLPTPESRRIDIPTAYNLRGLGGLPVRDGVFRAGQVFRSAQLSDLSDGDLPGFEALDIATVYDLRTAGERRTQPDRLPGGMRVVVLDVLADALSSAAANSSLTSLIADPAQAQDLLGGGRAKELMIQSYRDIVNLPSALRSYRAYFLDLADPQRTGAALFHCTTGKDRTGWAAASTLTFAGADRDTIYADYLETNTDLLPMTQPMVDAAAAQGIDPDLLWPVLGVDRDYLDTAFAEVERAFGSFDGYLRQGLGLTDDVLAALTARLVTTG